jgi:hypothetical protein
VKRFWQGEHHGVEAELRRYRPEPRPAFLAALSEDLHERMRRPRIVRRAALVTALTVGMLTTFATFGGIGYASSAAHSAFHVPKLGRLVGISHPSHSLKVSRHSHPTKGAPVQSPQAQSVQSPQAQSVQSPQAQSNDAQGDNPVFGDQYRPGKGCGDKNHIHLRENECKKPPK